MRRSSRRTCATPRLRLLADDLTALHATLEREVADEAALRERGEHVEAEAARAPRARGRAARPNWLPRRPRARRAPRRPGTGSPRCGSGYAARPGWPPSARGCWPTRREEPAGPRSRGAGARGGARSARRRPSWPTDVETAPRASCEDAVADPSRPPRLRWPPRSAGWPSSLRAAADRREGLARLQGKVNGPRSRASAAQAEIGRLTASLVDASRAGRDARRRSSTASRRRSPGSTPARWASTRPTSRPPMALVAAEERRRGAARGGARRRAGSQRARRPQGDPGARRWPAATAPAALLDSPAAGRRARLVAELLTVEPAAARPRSPRRWAVPRTRWSSTPSPPPSPRCAMLKATDGGQAHLFVGRAGPGARRGDGRWPTRRRHPVALAGHRARRALRAGAGGAARGLGRGRTTSTAAARWSPPVPELRAVTRDGDVLGAAAAAGGSAEPAEPARAAGRGRRGRRRGSHEADVTDRAPARGLAAADAEREAAGRAADEALRRLHESDAGLARPGRAARASSAAAARAARAEAERLAAGGRARPRRPATPGWPASPSWRNGWPRPRQQPDDADGRHRRSGRAWPRPAPAARAGRDSRPGSPCAPGRSASPGWPGAPTSLTRAALAEEAARVQAAARRVRA